MSPEDKERFVDFIKLNYTKTEAKHLIVDLESEKEFWETDLKAYLIASNDYDYMKLLIDKISDVHFQIEQVKQVIKSYES
jgi:hypothetical protein